MSQLLKKMTELAAGCRPLTADSRGEAFIVRQIVAPAIRQSLFSPLEEVVETNEFDPVADPPQSLRVGLEQANLCSRGNHASTGQLSQPRTDAIVVAVVSQQERTHRGYPRSAGGNSVLYSRKSKY